MPRNVKIVLVILLTGAFAAGSAFAQAPATSGGTTPQHRAAVAKKLNQRLPACKARANKLNIAFSERRAFIRKCLRG
jgi:hypothetical protein